MKSNKSYSKRIKVTRKGKLVARVPGQNHFNARQNGSERMRRSRATSFHAALNNTAKSRFLSK